MKLDPDALLKGMRDAAETAWAQVCLWGPRLMLVLVPLYVLWFGRRWPNPEVWDLESVGVACVYVGGVLWGVSLVVLALPIAVRRTAQIHGGRLHARTVAGRR